jgi:diguanylate cyclase (GGDEF)-like protein
MPEVVQQKRKFKLVSAFSLASLIGIILTSVIMGFFYREMAVGSLMKVREESNADLTRAFSNLVWGKYSAFFIESEGLDTKLLADREEIALLDQDVRSAMTGLRVVKVKIYNTRGITVFSTEKKQIGESKSDNIGFIGSMRGRIISEISYRDTFNAFDMVIEKRDLLSSYIPVFAENGGEVVGVFELYTDITSLLQEINDTERKIGLLTAVLMFALYAFLMIYIRRADSIIKQHELEEKSRQQEKIRYLQEHDQLTGLPNRTALISVLDSFLSRAMKSSYQVAVLHFDISNFNLINNNIGQQGGDQFLQQFASRLNSMVPADKTIGRVAGDEFVVILEKTGFEDIENLCLSLVKHMTEPFFVAGTEITTGISFGISLFPNDGSEAEMLLKNAETAMKNAKQMGRNRFAFFTETLNARAVDRFELEHGLIKAWNNSEFVLYFQPRVDAITGKPRSAEALIRWNRDGKIISPALFVPVLEETGLIVQVGDWVIREACACCKRWQSAGHQDIGVSVNLSMLQLQSGTLVDDVRSALLESGLDARFLELELTESLLADESEKTARLLAELKQLGIRFSIDDFGTGYSSLSYLIHYPIDSLKVDQSFVRDATRSQRQASLTRTIVAMAKGLELKTVAEGVEEQAQKDFLLGLGCDELQGYLFSRPVPEQAFIGYLEKS